MKSTVEYRIAVFEDTQKWIKENDYLNRSVTVSNSSVYYEDDYPPYDSSNIKSNSINVSKNRSYQAAQLLTKKYPSSRIAVMNFANAFHAGGGASQGVNAQEESLCRTSTLYPIITSQKLIDSFFLHHVKLDSPKASDSVIYSDNIIICKTDEEFPKRLPMEQWKTVDIITVAAPDLRVTSSHLSMGLAEQFGYHVKRIIHLLTVAAHKKADILVLGAFGCGSFKNDPHIVAKAFKTAIDVFPKVFEHIEFAVYCEEDAPALNYEAFSSIICK